MNDEQEFEEKKTEDFEVLPELSAEPPQDAQPGASADAAPPDEPEHPDTDELPEDTAPDEPIFGESAPEPSPEAESAAAAERALNLVRDIPLSVNVELGRTSKEISEILDFGFGTVIVLDKLAGDPAEVFANGKLIARGEVVVIDENYGVRITEIVQS
ncbi:MAG: flagellar motor switch protein FliN [Oscillospiraceae bacterium]|jgi:flagellar motor switch protein FliN/FliY|nr:flagellar motor switch protein FliN [Oscillospiraceae bacterium]